MLTNFLIVCPLVFLAGFVDAIAGGGGLISLPAYMMTGLPAHFAIGTNKLSSAMGTFATTVEFARSGYLRLRLASIAIVAALMGSFLGAKIALQLTDFYFRILLLIILPATALYLMLNRHALHSTTLRVSKLTKAQISWSVVIAFCLGIYDGFYGPGAGTFLLLLLTGLAHLPINLAAGTTKIINLTTNITALVVFFTNGKVLLVLGLVAGIFSIIGNHLGALYFKKYGSRIAKPITIVVLLIFLTKTIIDFLA